MDDNIDPSISDVALLDNHKYDIQKNIDIINNTDQDLFNLNYDDNNDNVNDNDVSDTAKEASRVINLMNLTKFDFEQDPISNPYVEYSDDDKLSGSVVKMVQYTPGEKTKRLGRPRKHITKKLVSPENHSSSNFNESVVSKFRLDSQPVEGPGSRGGRAGGRIGRGKKRSHQSALSFGDNTDSKKQTLKLTLQSPRREVKRRTISRDNILNGISKTTILRNKNKITRQLPGPLIGIYYDFYDENLMNPSKLLNNQVSSEIHLDDDYKYKIAAGYSVKKAPFASDILYIVAYLNKFRDIIRFEGICPQSLERGLSLPTNILTENYDPSYISDEMSRLFKRILTVVLNRKKDVVSHASAIMELRPMSQYLGLPKEWRDDELNENEDEVFSPVDPTTPEILMTRKTFYKYLTRVNYNPFKNNQFETLGLAGLPNPEDRLILFRTLMQWSFTSSDAIKNYITTTVQAQDVPGDRETMYGARSIIKGGKATEDSKREAESKLAKRKSEEEAKYVDPTTNPLDHSLKLRLMEELVGDCGYKVGRFFLCRLSNEANGGLTSMKKMESIWRDPPRSTARLPSQFKLYVQDVHSMLETALGKNGIEFDDNGEEILYDYSEEDIWFEVASNTSELHNFAEYLGMILGSGRKQTNFKTISLTSKIYTPLSNLRRFILSILPLLVKQEEISNPENGTYKRKNEYNDRKSINAFIDDTDEVHYAPEVGGDDDYADAGIPPGQEEEDYDYED